MTSAISLTGLAAATTPAPAPPPHRPTTASSAAHQSFADLERTLLPQLVSQEKQQIWDQYVGYAAVGFALVHFKDLERRTNFFLVLAGFLVIFSITAHMKARATILLQRRDVCSSGRLLPLLISRIMVAVLLYIGWLLIQIIMQRSSPVMSDGHWSAWNLALPMLLLTLSWIEVYVQDFRHQVRLIEKKK